MVVRRAWWRWWGVGIGSVAMASTIPCSAGDLPADVSRVERAWIAGSSRVTRLAPMFLFARQPRIVALPTHNPAGGDDDCMSVAVISDRSVNFLVEDDAEQEAGEKDSSARRSGAGVVTLSRCGGDREQLREIAISMASPRGTVEVIVAHGSLPPPTVDRILPERTAGPAGSYADVGPPPAVEPLASRVANAERRILTQGGLVASKRTASTDAQGRGSVRMVLTEGCHRIWVVPDNGAGQIPVDLDAEIHDASERLMARDRSNSADAYLEACVGDSRQVALVWASSLRLGKVTVVQGSWPIPRGIPDAWPSKVRAGMAGVHLRRSAPTLAGPPIWQGTGPSGRTSVPLEVQPSHCYLVMIAPARGEPRSVALTAAVGSTRTFDTSSGNADGALVMMCAGAERRAKMELEATGQNSTWMAAMWPVGRVPLGSESTR